MSQTNIQPALSEQAQFNETRASLYWWFATLLTKELTETELTQYFTGEGLSLLKALQQDPHFKQPVTDLRNSLAQLFAMQQPALELAADFSQLFLTDSKAGAPPYASVYLSESGQLFEKPHQQMVALFKQQGLVVDPSFNEPADHIAIQLDYLGNLIIQDGEHISAKQRDFINTHIVSWLPLFVSATKKVHNSGFYQALCQLLAQYIEQDLMVMD